MASLQDNLVVAYNFSESEIWPDKRGGLWWEDSYKKGTTESDQKMRI
jgi:hypothetical protein